MEIPKGGRHPASEVNCRYGWTRRRGPHLRVPLEQGQATVVTREDLIAMKRAAGRARDIEDIEALLGPLEDEP
jgi:hypothetical protein